MTTETTGTSAIRRSVTVECSVEHAWATFTERLHEWWPLETHSIQADEDRGRPESVAFDGALGGRVCEPAPEPFVENLPFPAISPPLPLRFAAPRTRPLFRSVPRLAARKHRGSSTLPARTSRDAARPARLGRYPTEPPPCGSMRATRP